MFEALQQVLMRTEIEVILHEVEVRNEGQEGKGLGGECEERETGGQTSGNWGGGRTQITHQLFLSQNARPARRTRGMITAKMIQPFELR